uniref:Lysine-specific demethylase 7A n=1 Tax=Anolis carolinensis TaxID=28377 RepID=A0A803TWJ2_ANOCA
SVTVSHSHAAATPVYCVCREPYDVSRFMIECDICKDWFHGSCVRVEEHHAVDIDLYHCPNCAVLHGPSLKNFVCTGGDKVIDVIDVARQADSKMKLHNYVKYFTNPDRPKVLNVISLEFSDTKMSELVEVPEIARKLSWVENYWPDDSVFPKPFVQKYCLMGVQDSYTDFHIDFGGTSVWYHVLWGEKIFYLIKPTDENLAIYESWSSSVIQSEVYFGDKVDKCYKCVVKQGHTLFVPTGWIHAVLTSQDCMAFGGNFLHNLNIGMQLRCYEMEKRLKTPDLFKFPFFEAICWFVAKNLLETLKELREDGFQPQTFLVQGVKALLSALKLWMKKDLVTEHAFEIPDNIRPGQLIKELSKVIRSIEEENNKTVKTQGISTCQVSRSSNELASTHHSRRKARKLRDHTIKTPSNLDILELHTREVLKRLEMSPWEEDTANYKLNERFNKPLQPSSTVPEWRTKDNDLRLLLSNGRIIRDERQPFRDSSLYTADSEDEDEKANSETEKTIKKEKQNSQEVEDNTDVQKPLNMFFESVKSELRNGNSEYSDISDSEESEPDCTNQVNTRTESECSGDEKQEVTSNIKEESKTTYNLFQTLQKPCKDETANKRECPTSRSMEEEAIQGMLSMAGLHYTTCLPDNTQSTDCTNRGNSLQEHRNYPKSRHKEKMSSYSHKTECGKFLQTAFSPLQDTNKTQKYIKKEDVSEASYRIQENRSHLQNNGFSFSHGKCAQDCSLIEGECRLSDGSLSPDRPYGETSLSVPLHPTKRPASNPPPINNQATKGKRPKKGMATAKQRLGKILKLNRNGHARFFV